MRCFRLCKARQARNAFRINDLAANRNVRPRYHLTTRSETALNDIDSRFGLGFTLSFSCEQEAFATLGALRPLRSGVTKFAPSLLNPRT